jgi:hypothetical protein
MLKIWFIPSQVPGTIFKIEFNYANWQNWKKLLSNMKGVHCCATVKHMMATEEIPYDLVRTEDDSFYQYRFCSVVASIFQRAGSLVKVKDV